MSVRSLFLRLLPLLVCGCSLNPVPEDPGVTGEFDQGAGNPIMPPNAGAPSTGGVITDDPHTSPEAPMGSDLAPGASMGPTNGAAPDPSLAPTGSSAPVATTPGASPSGTAPAPTMPEAPPATSNDLPVAAPEDEPADSGAGDAGAFESDASDAATNSAFDAAFDNSIPDAAERETAR